MVNGYGCYVENESCDRKANMSLTWMDGWMLREAWQNGTNMYLGTELVIYHNVSRHLAIQSTWMCANECADL